MRILVTGGHGFIGSRVTRQLCTRGDRVRCLVREKSRTHRIDDLSFERAAGDVRDAASVAAAMQGMDACIHLACVSAWADMRSKVLESTVLDGTRNVLDAARHAGVRRVVYVSSVAAVNAVRKTPRVFDETATFELEGSNLRYAIAKHQAEALCRTAAAGGLETVIVNPGEVYGRDDDDFVTSGNLRDVLTSWPALGCHGGNPVCHVDDIANGILLALEKGRSGERYILGGENLTVEQTIRLTLDIAGKRTPVVLPPNGLVKALLAVLRALHLPTPVVPEVFDFATYYWFVDSSKAERELGYRSRGAREAIESAVDWLYEAGHVKGARARPALPAPSKQ
ncbi:MAG TPA: NAD-dependent epimerase/dehydratase family protein [Polyangiaceae bacterium]